MRISRNWLSDFVDFDDLGQDEFAELLTTRVAEVEGVFTVAAPLDTAVVAWIEAVRRHPEKENLSLVSLSLGNGEKVEVVCGAPNCSSGQFAVYVPPGCSVVHAATAAGEPEKLLKVEERAVAGVMSRGVLVSEAELGLTDDHTGLVILTPELLAEAFPSGPLNTGLEAGRSVSDYIGGPDTIVEIDNKSLTHRPDLWSHLGFAREIGAILNRPLKLQLDDFADDRTAGSEKFQALGRSEDARYRVEIAPGCGCRRFAALEIAPVSVRPSPLWLRRRLYSIGAGVRHLLIDLSNYVMHDIGQPNHAYDADLLSGKTIFVRRAAEGERFRGLDGEERELTASDIVIADDSDAVALGGVIGGAKSSVADTTQRLLLESANFDPVIVRRTAKRHNVRTDASNRFEKSLSAYGVPLAIHRFLQILTALEPAARVVSRLADTFPEKAASVSVPFSFDYIRTRLGTASADQDISRILTSLGFNIGGGTKEMPKAAVPYYRATRDISIQDDLVEEVGRIHGYENIEEAAPKINSTAPARRAMLEFENKIQDTLTGLGFSEIYNYSFMSAAKAESCGYDVSRAVELENPLDANLQLIRTTLVPGMLETVSKNARYSSSMFLYELGRGYEIDGDRRTTGRMFTAEERRLLCLAYMSGVNESSGACAVKPGVAKGADYYAALNAVGRIAALVSRSELEITPLQFRAEGSAAPDFSAFKAWMHPYRAATLALKGRPLGIIAEVHPSQLDDLDERVVVAELDLELLLGADPEPRLFQPLPKFPDSFFEMSVVMPEKAHYTELRRIITNNVPHGLLRRLEVAAVYEGPPLEQGEKSISVKLSLGAESRTLSGEELSRIQNGLIETIGGSQFKLRS